MSPKPSAVESTPVRETRGKQLTIAPNEEGAQAFRNATRIQESLTSARERRVLLWLAARMPCWVTSDQLTLLGFAAMLLAGASYLLARWHPVGLLLATVCLALNWFGDSLDGTLARVRNMQRPRYGFYVDHMVDSFGALFLIAGSPLPLTWIGGSQRACLLLSYCSPLKVTWRLTRWEFSGYLSRSSDPRKSEFFCQWEMLSCGFVRALKSPDCPIASWTSAGW